MHHSPGGFRRPVKDRFGRRGRRRFGNGFGEAEAL